MAVFKCKMCGANLDVKENESVCTCQYCGSKQTISNSSDEKCKNLLNRGNAFRFRNEFDLAIDCYSHVISDYPEEAEAYWGLLLAKYGIEYVDDPRTGLKVATCHRTLYKSIFDDEDYLNAMKYADVVAKEVYQEQAKEIDLLQKRIISVSQKEEPFDIFICYKETDENKNRTKDSVFAQDIYDKLTEKGYRVFFAKITLESRLGFEYEPIIFAALRSAKVMLAIGSKAEYFDSVWVKNEWSRFLEFMKEDKNKYLIPCYIDMDAYDMPEAFMPLQSQDMSKIGYLQDLTRGIDKLFNKTNKKVVKEVQISETSPNDYVPIEMALEKGDYSKAVWYLNELRRANPNADRINLYSYLIKNQIPNLYALSRSTKRLDNDPDFILALESAKGNIKASLQEMSDKIKNKAYGELITQAKGYINNLDYQKAVDILKDMQDNTQAADLLKYCYTTVYDKAVASLAKNDYEKAYFNLCQIKGYDKAAQKLEIAREGIYQQGIALFKEGKYPNALAKFKNIAGYKDSNQIYNKCNEEVQMKVFVDNAHEFIIRGNIGAFNQTMKNFEKFSYHPKYEELVEKLNKEKFVHERTVAIKKKKKAIIKWSVISLVIVLAITGIILMFMW